MIYLIIIPGQVKKDKESVHIDIYFSNMEIENFKKNNNNKLPSLEEFNHLILNNNINYIRNSIQIPNDDIIKDVVSDMDWSNDYIISAKHGDYIEYYISKNGEQHIRNSLKHYDSIISFIYFLIIELLLFILIRYIFKNNKWYNELNIKTIIK